MQNHASVPKLEAIGGAWLMTASVDVVHCLVARLTSGSKLTVLEGADLRYDTWQLFNVQTGFKHGTIWFCWSLLITLEAFHERVQFKLMTSREKPCAHAHGGLPQFCWAVVTCLGLVQATGIAQRLL